MIPSFLYSLAGGMLVVLAAGKPSQLSWKYLRLIAIIAFAIALGDSLWLIKTFDISLFHLTGAGVWAGLVMALGAIVLLFIAPVAVRYAAAYRTMALFAGLAGIAAAVGITWLRMDASLAPRQPAIAAALILLGQVCGSLLLGSITVSWLLGHAYLTATKMTIDPLRRFTRLLAAAVLLRALFVALAVLLGWLLLGDAGDQLPGQGGTTTQGPAFFDLMYGSWLIVFLRVGLGIIGVGAFAYMVLDCVRLRSTQSATGILYFGSIFAYIGELASQYLLYEWGWPI